jgi:hypothetical protein
MCPQYCLRNGGNINYKNHESATILDFHVERSSDHNSEYFIEFLKNHGAKRACELPHS